MPDSNTHDDERRQAERREELASPTGGHFYAPVPDRRKGPRGRRKEDLEAYEAEQAAKKGQVDYKLRHRSQRDFPQAYEPVSRSFWGGLSKQQQDAVMRLQAVAMEKAGFEKGTPKMFIADFDPSNPDKPMISPGAAAVDRGADAVAMAAPRLMLAGALLGMGGLSLALALCAVLAPLAPIAAGSVIALIVGVLLAANARG
jgi:hypothetical protein